MGKSKFDTYFDVSKKIASELSKVGCKQLASLVDSLSKSIEQIDGWISNDDFPVKKSEIGKGLEQGINELPQILEDLDPEYRSQAFSAYYEAVNSVIPDYFQKLESRIARIIRRGTIKSESEYYLLRNRLDQIEGREKYDDEEEAISNLLGKYELMA